MNRLLVVVDGAVAELPPSTRVTEDALTREMARELIPWGREVVWNNQPAWYGKPSWYDHPMLIKLRG